MTIFQALILGLLQGATEFLPISSSGHLVLVPWLLRWDASGLTFDTTVHLGTLLAVLIYFRKDVGQIIKGVFITLQERSLNDMYGRLGWFIVLGTIPAAVLGVLFEDFFESLFGTPTLVAMLLIVTGLILFVGERFSNRTRDLDSLTWKDGLLVGLAQAGAIMPGISRSGSTIAAAMGMGFHRPAAARFSFLLALPIIFGAGMLQLKDAVDVGISGGDLTVLLIGFVAAFVSGYACIAWLLRLLQNKGVYAFAYYCWAAGGFFLLMTLFR